MRLFAYFRHRREKAARQPMQALEPLSPEWEEAMRFHNRNHLAQDDLSDESCSFCEEDLKFEATFARRGWPMTAYGKD